MIVGDRMIKELLNSVIADYRNLLRWPNTISNANAISQRAGITQSIHGVEKAIILFGQCPRYLCFFLFKIELNTVFLCFTFFYENRLLEKRTEQRTSNSRIFLFLLTEPS